MFNLKHVNSTKTSPKQALRAEGKSLLMSLSIMILRKGLVTCPQHRLWLLCNPFPQPVLHLTDCIFPVRSLIVVMQVCLSRFFFIWNRFGLIKSRYIHKVLSKDVTKVYLGWFKSQPLYSFKLFEWIILCIEFVGIFSVCYYPYFPSSSFRTTIL